MNVAQGSVGSDPVILATAGYDHTVRFWQAHSGVCTRTLQHQHSLKTAPQERTLVMPAVLTIKALSHLDELASNGNV
uniref:Uncharacterized protein n=1 Tax=Eptatretus burgeri TaxID=7764 RepID=A0A8C4WXN5_EPTBU